MGEPTSPGSVPGGGRAAGRKRMGAGALHSGSPGGRRGRVRRLPRRRGSRLPEWRESELRSVLLTRDLDTMLAMARGGAGLRRKRSTWVACISRKGREEVLPYLFLDASRTRSLLGAWRKGVVISAQDLPGLPQGRAWMPSSAERGNEPADRGTPASAPHPPGRAPGPGRHLPGPVHGVPTPGGRSVDGMGRGRPGSGPPHRRNHGGLFHLHLPGGWVGIP